MLVILSKIATRMALSTAHTSAKAADGAKLVSWCFTALSAQIGYAIEVGNVSHRAGGEHKHHSIKQRKNTINQHNHKLSSAWALWR